MADISMKQPHGKELDEAKQIIEKVVNDVKSEYPSLVDTIDWNGEKTQAKVKGKAFSGDFSIDSDNVAIDINLKLFAKPFKGKVTKTIESRIEKYFG